MQEIKAFNEKRAEIHDIEARLKLNVILIPNVNLETPNYTIDHLRNEDTNNKPDETLASYQMVDRTTEEVTIPSTENKSKPTRQKAAVQNITPAIPAPIRTEKSRESLLDKFFGWFKPVETEEEKTEAMNRVQFGMMKNLKEKRAFWIVITMFCVIIWKQLKGNLNKFQ